jgi:tetratricopeptide (TPR) repeat protein
MMKFPIFRFRHLTFNGPSRLLGLILLVSMVPGLAGAGVLDHQWCRYSVGAWEIITDLPEQRVQPIVTNMHRVAQIFAHLHAESAVSVTTPVQLWIFRSAVDYRKNIGDQHSSGLTIPSLNRVRLVFGPVQGHPDRDGLLSNARHEFTHFLQRSSLDQQLPRWQEEGQASLLGNMKWRDDGNLIEFSAVAPIEAKIGNRQLRALLTSNEYPFSRLSKARLFYQSAQMFETENMRRRAYGSKSRGDIQTLPEGFWKQSQPEAKLVQPLLTFPTRRFLQRGSPALKFRFDQLPNTVAENSPLQQADCLTSSELSLQLASLVATLNPKRAKRLLDGIPAEDREQTLWLVQSSRVMGAEMDFVASVREAERALALTPDDPSAQIQLATALVGRCWALVEEGCVERWGQAEELYRSALRRLPDRFDAIFGLGLARLHTGLSGDGLNYLRIAYQRAPWSPIVNFYLGEAYRLVGNPQADIHLRKAAAWSHDPTWRKRAEQALETLAGLDPTLLEQEMSGRKPDDVRSEH